MSILLLAATEMEISPFLKNNKNIDVLVTGVGVPATVYHLTKKILQNDFKIVVQAGIAGSFTKNILPGEVVIVQQDIFADIGIEEGQNFRPVFDVGPGDKNSFPFENGWLINPNAFLRATQLRNVKAITVNKISDKKSNTKQLIDYYKADIESMEGAALHYVCLQQKMPFIQLRSISNEVGERDKNKWKMKEAVANLNAELEILLNSLTENI